MASEPPEKAVNRLVVKEARMGDNSICGIHAATMDRLSLSNGDIVLLKTERGRTTACMALADDVDCEEHQLRITRVVMSNLRARVADAVSVRRCDDFKYGERVHILPVEDTLEGITGCLHVKYLKPYFLDAFRPVHKGHRFLVRRGTRSVEFKVVEIDPPVEFCGVSNFTEITCDGAPVKREDGEERLDDVGYGDVGGGGRQEDNLLDQGAGRAATHEPKEQ